MNVHLQDENTRTLYQTLHNNTDKGNLVSPLLQHQNHLFPTDLIKTSHKQKSDFYQTHKNFLNKKIRKIRTNMKTNLNEMLGDCAEENSDV
jgi:hypothetical protein